MLYNMFPYIHQTSIQFCRQFFALDSISIVSMPDSGFKVFRALSYILYFLYFALSLMFLQPSLRLMFLYLTLPLIFLQPILHLIFLYLTLTLMFLQPILRLIFLYFALSLMFLQPSPANLLSFYRPHYFCESNIHLSSAKSKSAKYPSTHQLYFSIACQHVSHVFHWHVSHIFLLSYRHVNHISLLSSQHINHISSSFCQQISNFVHSHRYFL